MSRLIHKARVLLSVNAALMLEMRSEILLWMLATMFPLIMMGVWAKAGDSGKFSLTSSEFVRYFAALFVVRQLTIVWVIFEFEEEVLQGRLSPYLLQPMDPVWRHVARHVAERFVRLPFVALILAGLLLLVPMARWSPSAFDIAAGLFFSMLAFTLRFVIQYTFALLAFWTERAVSVENCWFLIYIFMSGIIGPLDVFPEGVRQAALLTPFPYLMYYPAQVLLGREVDLLWLTAVLCGWIAVFFVINRLLWRVALKQYSSMGA